MVCSSWVMPVIDFHSGTSFRWRASKSWVVVAMSERNLPRRAAPPEGENLATRLAPATAGALERADGRWRNGRAAPGRGAGPEVRGRARPVRAVHRLVRHRGPVLRPRG